MVSTDFRNLSMSKVEKNVAGTIKESNLKFSSIKLK